MQKRACVGQCSGASFEELLVKKMKNMSETRVELVTSQPPTAYNPLQLRTHLVDGRSTTELLALDLMLWILRTKYMYLKKGDRSGAWIGDTEWVSECLKERASQGNGRSV